MKYLVTGYKHGVGDTFSVCESEDEGSVVRFVSKVPIEHGGFVRFSVSEVEDFPEEAYICCPKCSHSFLDPSKVLDLG